MSGDATTSAQHGLWGEPVLGFPVTKAIFVSHRPLLETWFIGMNHCFIPLFHCGAGKLPCPAAIAATAAGRSSCVDLRGNLQQQAGGLLILVQTKNWRFFCGSIYRFCHTMSKESSKSQNFGIHVQPFLFPKAAVPLQEKWGPSSGGGVSVGL